MKSHFAQLEKKLDEIVEEMTEDQREASPEQDARQPRLAMKADGHAYTKTRERTEGAATAVQAMHGDSCSAEQVDPDPICSTSFGDDCTGPPALSCSGENALVDNRAAAPKSFLSSLGMRSRTAAGGLLPTGEASTATNTTFNQSPLWLYSTEGTNSKEKNYGLQFHPPGTTAASGSCLLPPPARGLLRQNPDKIGRSIQAVLKVVSAPARFWERTGEYSTPYVYR